MIWIYLDIFEPDNCSYDIIKNSLKDNNYIFIPISKIINDSLIYSTKSVFNYYLKANFSEDMMEIIKEMSIVLNNNDEESELLNVVLYPFTSTISQENINLFPSKMICKSEILNVNIPSHILFSTIVLYHFILFYYLYSHFLSQ